MGRARQLWDEFSAALAKGDDQAVRDVYADDAVYLEPNNPPHEGHLLIQSYLNSWMQARTNLEVTVNRVLESEDGADAGGEWTISYDGGGRRWRRLRSVSWIDVGDEYIRYHRDYY
jgi:ketosteroid isomerase-like protein